MLETEEAVLQACSTLTDQDVLECIEDALGLIEFGMLMRDKELVLAEAIELGKYQRPEPDHEAEERTLRDLLGDDLGAEAAEHIREQEKRDDVPRLNVPKMSMPLYVKRRYDQVVDQAARFLAA